jgi:hypothetical protein
MPALDWQLGNGPVSTGPFPVASFGPAFQPNPDLDFPKIFPKT